MGLAVGAVLADKRVYNGALNYQPNIMDIMTGWLGNVITINGMSGPVTAAVEPAIIRLRLLNASNARILNPALANGRSFWLIGTDGGLLAAPVSVNNLLLAPGERADVLLDLRADAGQTIRFISAAFSSMGAGMMGFAPPQGAAFDLLNIVVSGAPATNAGSVPGSFAPISKKCKKVNRNNAVIVHFSIRAPRAASTQKAERFSSTVCTA